jgi:hypothetical protein
MRYAGTALVLALLALPALAHAQADPPRPANPAARLLELRAELALTADQVSRLEAVERRTSEQDRTLRQRLEELRGAPAGQPLRFRDMTEEQRTRLEANRAEMAPVMMRLRALHAQAAADIAEVLTAEQRTRVAGRMFRGPAAGYGRGPGAGPAWGPGRGRGMGPGFNPGGWGPRHARPWMQQRAWGRGMGPGWWGPGWREEN